MEVFSLEVRRFGFREPRYVTDFGKISVNFYPDSYEVVTEITWNISSVIDSAVGHREKP